jgi:hypothetical protein
MYKEVTKRCDERGNAGRPLSQYVCARLFFHRPYLPGLLERQSRSCRRIEFGMTVDTPHFLARSLDD